MVAENKVAIAAEGILAVALTFTVLVLVVSAGLTKQAGKARPEHLGRRRTSKP